MFINVNGTRLYYEVLGEGRPLIMVHGNSEDHTIFYEAAEILKDSFRIYLVDSRGHGQSAPAEELHYTDMAHDYASFMRALGLRDVVFYGFSDGGIIGLLAAMHTGRITDLIVSGANLTPRGIRRGTRTLMRTVYMFKKDPKIRMMLREPRITPQMLGRITCRTMVLAGSRDLIKPRETLLIASSIPQARLRILRGEDHGSYIIHSIKIAEMLLEILDEGEEENE